MLWLDSSSDLIRFGGSSDATSTSIAKGGNVGIGAGATSTAGLYVSKVETITSGSFFGANLAAFLNPASASSASLVGFQGTARSYTGNAQNFTGIFYGSIHNVTHQGSGTMNTAYGGQFYNSTNGGGVITNSYAIKVANGAVSGVGSAITNQYGIYVDALTSGGTLNYAIYTNAGLVRLGDRLLPQQATTAGAPAYVNGAVWFDTTLDKLKIGGASVYETVLTDTFTAYGILFSNPSGNVTAFSNFIFDSAAPSLFIDALTASPDGWRSLNLFASNDGSADTTNVGLTMTAWGTPTIGTYIKGIQSAGTKAAPTAVGSGVNLFRVRAGGHDGNVAGVSSNSTSAEMKFLSNQIFTTSAHGTRIEFYTTPDASTTLTLALTIGNNGSILSPTIGGIGYTTGAGGTVTQATNKATGVTLNKVTGLITMNNAALAANTTVSFTLTNSAIAATDTIILQHNSAGTVGAYTLNVQPAAGSAVINVRNVTAGSLSEAIVIRFTVIKSISA
jgi:hypothetical protein